MENPNSQYRRLVRLFNLEVIMLTITSSLWVVIYLLTEGMNWIYDLFFFSAVVVNCLYYIIAQINFKKDIYDIPRFTNMIPILANPANLFFAFTFTMWALDGYGVYQIISFASIFVNFGFYMAFIRRILLLSKEIEQIRPRNKSTRSKSQKFEESLLILSKTQNLIQLNELAIKNNIEPLRGKKIAQQILSRGMIIGHIDDLTWELHVGKEAAKSLANQNSFDPIISPSAPFQPPSSVAPPTDDIPFLSNEKLMEEYTRYVKAQTNLKIKENSVKPTLYYKLMGEYAEKLENLQKEAVNRGLELR